MLMPTCAWHLVCSGMVRQPERLKHLAIAVACAGSVNTAYCQALQPLSLQPTPARTRVPGARGRRHPAAPSPSLQTVKALVVARIGGRASRAVHSQRRHAY